MNLVKTEIEKILNKMLKNFNNSNIDDIFQIVYSLDNNSSMLKYLKNFSKEYNEYLDNIIYIENNILKLIINKDKSYIKNILLSQQKLEKKYLNTNFFLYKIKELNSRIFNIIKHFNIIKII